jgi:stage II sporulation protein D
LGGKNLNFNFFATSCFIGTARWLFRRAVFFILVGVVFWAGCSRQIHKPAKVPSAIKPPEVRVAIVDHLVSATLFFRDEYILHSEEADYILDDSAGEFLVKASNGKLVLSSPKRQFVFQSYFEFEFKPKNDGVFEWNGAGYHGKLAFAKSGDNITAINILQMPEYLKGVVPNEIPSHDEEYYQAILAQTVAARSYALYQVEHPASPFFDLYSDFRDQVYGGIATQSELSDRAVEETAGLVLVNENKQVQETQYHSTCGGNLEIRPEYFAGLASAESFKPDMIDGIYNCLSSPLYRWVKKLTTRNILKNMVKTGHVPGDIASSLIQNGFDMQIKIVSRLPSGRVERVSIGVNGTPKSVGVSMIRSIFSDPDGRVLPSRYFFLKQSKRQPDLVYVIGAGFGHGIGMCQWGAIGQSLKGIAYQEILKFYYPGLTLNHVY